MVTADNFCPIDRTIWQCFESEFAIHKSFLHLLSLSLLLLLLIPFLILLPPSGSRLQMPLTATNNAHYFIFFYRQSFPLFCPSVMLTCPNATT